MANNYIKTNRTFSTLRNYGWILTILIAIGGLWLPKLGLLVVFIMAGLTVSGFFSGRYWCGNICPMGTIQKALGVTKKTEKKITISDAELCYACGKCAKACPFQLTPHLDFSDNNQFDDTNCIKCSTCIEVCPAGILSLSNEEKTIKLKELEISQRYIEATVAKGVYLSLNILNSSLSSIIYLYILLKKY